MLNNQSKSKKKRTQGKSRSRKIKPSESQKVCEKKPSSKGHQYPIRKSQRMSQCSLLSLPKKIKVKKSNARKNNQNKSISNFEAKKHSKEKKNSRKEGKKRSPAKINPKESKREEVYEIVNIKMCKSKTHSEINFSNDSSVRLQNKQPEKQNMKLKKNLTIQCSDQYILNQYFSNSRIKNNQRSKIEAAIKIQKVFRGYLTRKMLRQYIQRQEENVRKLSEMYEKSENLSFSSFDFPLNKTFKGQQKMKVSIQEVERENSIQQVNDDEILEQSSIKFEAEPSHYLSNQLKNEEVQLAEQEKCESSKQQVSFEGQKYISFDQLKSQIQKNPSQDSKNTPILSHYSKKQEPMPTDFSEKRISDFPSQFEQNENQAKMKKENYRQSIPLNSSTKAKRMIADLKRQQHKKWNYVINVLNQQIIEVETKNEDMMKFMREILYFSKKNKEQLEIEQTMNQNSGLQRDNSEIQSKEMELQKKPFSKNMNLQIEVNPLKHFHFDSLSGLEKKRNAEQMPLLPKKEQESNKKKSINLYETTENLKKYLSKNIFDYPIEEMVYLREKALEKKQKEEVDKINYELHHEILTHEQFLLKLKGIQENFQSQKSLIIQAKEHIIRGYKATHKLIQQSFKDAQCLGFKIPFSRSMDQIKNQNTWINEIIVDQIRSIKSRIPVEAEPPFPRKYEESSIDIDESASLGRRNLNNSSSLLYDQSSYNEYELENQHLNLSEKSEQEGEIGDFRKIDISSSLRRKYSDDVFIGDDMRGIQSLIVVNKKKISDEGELHPSISCFPKSEVYKIDESSEEQMIFHEDEVDPSLNETVNDVINQLTWQLCGEFFQTPKIRRKLLHNVIKDKEPYKISEEEKLHFLGTLINKFPSFEDLYFRLNQKMGPTKLELLKHMRVSIEEDSSSSTPEEEASRWELILSEQFRISIIDPYIDKEVITYDEPDLFRVQDMLRQYNLSQNCMKQLFEREKALKKSNQQREQLRKQIKKIELHCIFDGMNQMLMRNRIKKVGYSGIGLNQLSSVWKQNEVKSLDTIKCFEEYKQDVGKKMIQLVSEEKNTHEKLLLENYEQLCINDSQWVMYSDEALSFALELAFLIDDELFCEATDDIYLHFHP